MSDELEESGIIAALARADAAMVPLERYTALLDICHANHETYERNMNFACAFAWDMGRRTTEVKCYWCGAVLGTADRDSEAIKAHTATCAKRGGP